MAQPVIVLASTHADRPLPSPPQTARQGLRQPFVQHSSQRVLELLQMGMGFLRDSEEQQN